MAQRRKHRFNNLLETYRHAGGNGDTGSRVKDFGNWLTGKTHIKVERRPASTNMARLKCVVIPFGLEVEGDPGLDNYATAFTGQAYAIWNGLTHKPIFGLSPITEAATVKYVTANNFYPALARIFTVKDSSVTSTGKTSAILPNQPQYKRFLGRSGSVPFGRATASEITDEKNGKATTPATETYDDAVTAIIKNCKGAQNGFFVKGISFSPEIFVAPSSVANAPSSPPNLNFS